MKIKSIILAVITAFSIFAASPVYSFADETNGTPYFYGDLTAEEKAAYDSLLIAVNEGSDTAVTPSVLSEESIERIKALLLYYSPKHFNIAGIESTSEQTFAISYRFDKEKYEEMKSAVDARVAEILAIADTKTSEYTKLVSIHDEINKNCSYSDISGEKSTVYGALVVGLADSFGYAEAFCLIAEKAGIPSFVNIYTENGVTKARSSVSLDAYWYNIDCAKDDISRFAENDSYGWFMVPDSFYSGTSPYSVYFVSPAAVAINNYYYKAAELDVKTDVEARVLFGTLIADYSKTKKSTVRFTFSDTAALNHFIKTVSETSFLTDALDIVAKYTAEPIVTDIADISFNMKTRVVTLVIYYPDTKLSDYYTDTSNFTPEQLQNLSLYGIN
ncbi:MAG: transglutaminase-like domain-containing protein [Ruminococcus sp.]|jgi:hypothetical protein|nr:transglutaminase-like domain-containing protein [Ruminococcus sp.]